MKALCWHGHGDVRCDTVPDPKLEKPDDIIVKITTSGICGSDLHIYDGYIPTMKAGDILGHEPMGIVTEVGKGVQHLEVGDRVVIPFTLACGECFFCKHEYYSCCDNSNPNKKIAEKILGHSPSALFGYSHMLGGIPGGQAQYLRVPYANVGPLKIESDLPDEKVVFLSDVFPTGYMAAENAEIQKGDTVAVWGCGPVGLFAMQSAWMLGAGRVIGIDRIQERLDLAKNKCNAEAINFDKDPVYDVLQDITKGRGPDRCIDCVGAEAHGMGSIDAVVDKVKAAVKLTTDRAHGLREAIYCCRKAGTVSVAGAYLGFPDKIPMGAFMNKALTMKSGQTHVQKFMKPLLEKIEKGEIDPSFIITHKVTLEGAPEAYRKFRDKTDECIKVVIQPS